MFCASQGMKAPHPIGRLCWRGSVAIAQRQLSKRGKPDTMLETDATRRRCGTSSVLFRRH